MCLVLLLLWFVLCVHCCSTPRRTNPPISNPFQPNTHNSPTPQQNPTKPNQGLFFIEGVNRGENLPEGCHVCPHAAWWGGRFEVSRSLAGMVDCCSLMVML